MNTLPRNSNFLNPPIVLTVVASFPLVLVFLLLQRHPDHVAGYYNCSPLQRETAISKLYGLVCGPDPEANQLDRCANAAGTQGLLSG